jgi:hypothetical protein
MLGVATRDEEVTSPRRSDAYACAPRNAAEFVRYARREVVDFARKWNGPDGHKQPAVRDTTRALDAVLREIASWPAASSERLSPLLSAAARALQVSSPLSQATFPPGLSPVRPPQQTAGPTADYARPGDAQQDSLPAAPAIEEKAEARNEAVTSPHWPFARDASNSQASAPILTPEARKTSEITARACFEASRTATAWQPASNDVGALPSPSRNVAALAAGARLAECSRTLAARTFASSDRSFYAIRGMLPAWVDADALEGFDASQPQSGHAERRD